MTSRKSGQGWRKRRQNELYSFSGFLGQKIRLPPRPSPLVAGIRPMKEAQKACPQLYRRVSSNRQETFSVGWSKRFSSRLSCNVVQLGSCLSYEINLVSLLPPLLLGRVAYASNTTCSLIYAMYIDPQQRKVISGILALLPKRS